MQKQIAAQYARVILDRKQYVHNKIVETCNHATVTIFPLKIMTVDGVEYSHFAQTNKNRQSKVQN